MVLKKLIKDEEVYYHFRVKRDDIRKAFAYKSFLEKHSKKRSPIPQRILKAFFELFDFVELDLNDQVNKEISIKRDKVCAYFEELKEYSKIDLRELIDVTIVEIYTYQLKHGKFKKTDFMHYCYNVISNNSKIGHSKTAILTAYITLVFDYRLSKSLMELYDEKSKPTTNDLFQAVKSQLKKYSRNLMQPSP